jgi:diguanylate cyclase (GGDEF)-like protein/PAS domain S-box-containing protein
MKKKIDQIHQQLQQQLRASAEAHIADAEPLTTSVLAADNLLHELRVYEVELEIQNEELQRTQAILELSRAHYAELYDFAPVGYLTINAEGLITELNFTAEKLLGVDRKYLILRHFARYVADIEMDRWYLKLKKMLRNSADQHHSFDLQLRRGDGSTFHGHFNCQLSKNDVLSPLLKIALIDVTPLKEAENLRLSAIAFEMHNGILVTDNNKIIIHVNQAFCRILGYSAEEVVGQNSSILRSGQYDERFYEKLWATVAANGQWEGEILDRRKNGKLFPAWHTITAVAGMDGVNSHYVGSFMDITEQKSTVEKLERLAFYDPLTQLPNRRLLKDRLHLALAHSTRSKQYGVLLFIDLDNFKLLNDTLGHNMGDELLQQVATRLVNNVREIDTVARLGGDEFVVMLEDMGETALETAVHAEMAGKKLLSALNESYMCAHYPYRCSSSIGIAVFYGNEVTEDELLKHVDIALYQAKNSGRNKLCFFDQAMQIALTERAALEADLQLALGKDQIELYYQVQISHDNLLMGAEVLLRWQHQQHGVMSPLDFIPLAEELGLIIPIGLWALETACAQLKAWENNPQTQGLQLAVNISASQLQQIDFVGQVSQVLKKTKIQPSRLKLELTENMLLKNVDECITIMLGLKALGVSLSLDDFGTGYSSLSYLTQLPLDQLKIDQSFVHNIGVKHTDAVIVSTIIAMAKSLNMEVIAEGVETQAQRDFLHVNGCNLYQGYLFSKPMPIDEFEAFLGSEELDSCFERQ